MDRSLRIIVLGAVVATAIVSSPSLSTTASAAELDKKGKSDAKEAMRFYKEGSYEDAARLFLRLSINYPDMLVFVRNLGACYYYMRRYEPALSNLRDYLHRKTDIADDDRAEIAGWIGEMERLRDQATAPPPAPPPAAPPAAAPAPAPVPVPVPAVPAPSTAEGAASAAAAAPAPATPPAVSPEPGAPAVPAAPPAAPGSAAGPSSAPSPAGYPGGDAFPSQPSYAPAPAPGTQFGAPAADPYGTQPQYAAPAGQYGGQAYPPGQYAQPQYPPAAYGPGYAQPPYAPGVGAQARPPQSSGTGRKVGAWLLGIAGVGVLGGGGYLSYLAMDRFNQIEKKYDPDKEKQAKNYVIGAGVCYGVGGAVLLTAIIIGATGGSSGQVALAPTVGPGMAGAALGGSF
jgi:hypothetical protein